MTQFVRASLPSDWEAGDDAARFHLLPKSQEEQRVSDLAAQVRRRACDAPLPPRRRLGGLEAHSGVPGGRPGELGGATRRAQAPRHGQRRRACALFSPPLQPFRLPSFQGLRHFHPLRHHPLGPPCLLVAFFF
ncbi:MAG: hypothetical protein VX113_08520, partial [Pseudomonadota bacterium]|nr:hypothetical protein [Pseudomonadota bacterium]